MIKRRKLTAGSVLAFALLMGCGYASTDRATSQPSTPHLEILATDTPDEICVRFIQDSEGPESVICHSGSSKLALLGSDQDSGRDRVWVYGVALPMVRTVQAVFEKGEQAEADLKDGGFWLSFDSARRLVAIAGLDASGRKIAGCHELDGVRVDALIEERLVCPPGGSG